MCSNLTRRQFAIGAAALAGAAVLPTVADLREPSYASEDDALLHAKDFVTGDRLYVDGSVYKVVASHPQGVWIRFERETINGF